MSLKKIAGNYLPHELTTRQKAKLRNVFNNIMSTDLKLSKAQISKILQSGGFSGGLFSKLAGPLWIAPLWITAAASALDAGIQKKIHGSRTTTLIISNDQMND